MMIYLMDSPIQLLNNWGLLVTFSEILARNLQLATCTINLYPLGMIKIRFYNE